MRPPNRREHYTFIVNNILNKYGGRETLLQCRAATISNEQRILEYREIDRDYKRLRRAERWLQNNSAPTTSPVTITTQIPNEIQTEETSMTNEKENSSFTTFEVKGLKVFEETCSTSDLKRLIKVVEKAAEMG